MEFRIILTSQFQYSQIFVQVYPPSWAVLGVGNVCTCWAGSVITYFQSGALLWNRCGITVVKIIMIAIKNKCDIVNPRDKVSSWTERLRNNTAQKMIKAYCNKLFSNANFEKNIWIRCRIDFKFRRMGAYLWNRHDEVTMWKSSSLLMYIYFILMACSQQKLHQRM